MAEGEVVYEEDVIRDIMAQALRSGVLMELLLSGEGDPYIARLLSGAGGTPFTEDNDLLLSPLEPTSGNIKIRRATQIQLCFHYANKFYESKVTFVKPMATESGQGLAISVPRVLRASSRRQQPRVEVPSDLEFQVRIEQRGTGIGNGYLSDISSGGLSFISDLMKDPLEKGTRVTAVISGREMGPPLSLSSMVTFTLRMRKVEDTQVAVDKIGVQFGVVNGTQSMQLDRLIKLLVKRAKPV